MKINYEKIAEQYEKTRNIEPFVYYSLSTLLNPQDGDFFLDVGCGTGNYLKKFMEDYKIVPYGIEPSINMRKFAQQKLSFDCIFNGSHEALPYLNIVFDKIYCTDVIHHINSLNNFFQNLLSVAAPNAKLCICTESTSQLSEKYWIKYFPEILEVDLQRFHSIRDIIAAGEHAGWAHCETLKIEEEFTAPISSSFMERVRQKSLSVFQLISDKEYKNGYSVMEHDYKKQILIHQNEGYTFILFKKGK